MSVCIVCSAPIPESARASWVKADKWCWGCHSYVCQPCTLAKGPVPPGPHDPTMHGAAAGPWPPQEPPPRDPDPEPVPDPSAAWGPTWPSYSVLSFDVATAVLEAFVVANEHGLDPTADARLDRLKLQAAFYLAKHRSSTLADQQLAREVIRRHLPKRTASA